MNKTLAIELSELRQQIANEIADGTCACSDDKDYCNGYNNATRYASRIALGTAGSAVHTPNTPSSEKIEPYHTITLASYSDALEVRPMQWFSIGSGTGTVQKRKKDIRYWKNRFWWRIHDYVSDKVGGCDDL